MLSCLTGIFGRNYSVRDKEKREIDGSNYDSNSVEAIAERVERLYEMLRHMGVGQMGIIPQCAREAGEERRKDGKYIRILY